MEKPVDLAQTKPLTLKPASPTYEDQRTGTILLVDDDPIILYVVTEVLMQVGLRVFPCASGEAALRNFTDHKRVDLLITDFQMPSISGIQLAAALTRMQPDLPVLVMSASLLPARAAAIVRQQRWSFLGKPLEITDLLKQVNALLCSRVVEAPRILAVNKRR